MRLFTDRINRLFASIGMSDVAAAAVESEPNLM
jgi:hypothetical protein